MTGPKLLEGTRVLDLSRVLAGPWCGQLLADYGADVIKVERPQIGDDTRAWGPPWWGDPADRMAAYYISANRGKRSIAIDIATAEGAALVCQLAAQADVLLENYKVGQLAKYGLDHASLSLPTRAWSTARSPAMGKTAPTPRMPATTLPSRPPAG